MKRWRIEHDRDPLTREGMHWNLFEVDTNDPHEDPYFVGFGSWETCVEFAFGTADLVDRTGLMR